MVESLCWRVENQTIESEQGWKGEGSNRHSRHSNHTKVIHSEILMAKLAELTVNEVSSGKELHPWNVGQRSNKAYSKEREGDTADNSTGNQKGKDSLKVLEPEKEATATGMHFFAQTQKHEKLESARKNNNALEKGSQSKVLVDISNKGGNG